MHGCLLEQAPVSDKGVESRRIAGFPVGTPVAVPATVSHRREDCCALARDLRGTVAAEYLILVALVGFVVGAGVIFVGFPLLHQYRFMQYVLTSPVV